jgi:hypothetical protein
MQLLVDTVAMNLGAELLVARSEKSIETELNPTTVGPVCVSLVSPGQDDKKTCPSIVLNQLLQTALIEEPKVEAKHPLGGAPSKRVFQNGTSAKQYIESAMALVLRIFSVYGFEKKGYSMKHSVSGVVWLLDNTTADSSDPSLWMRLFKHLILSFWNYWSGIPYQHNSDFPWLEKPGELLKGRAYRWLRTRQYDFEGLMNTMLIGVKGGCPRPTDEILEKALDEWKRDLFYTLEDWKDSYNLDYPDPLGPLDHLRYRQERDDVLLMEIEYQLEKLLDTYPKVTVAEVLLEPAVPSTSSNYVNDRADGGTVGTMLGDPEFQSYIRCHQIDLDAKVEAIEVSYVPSLKKGNRVKYFPVAKYEYDSNEIRVNYAHTFLYAYNRCNGEMQLVEPVALAEALKVRIITKMPAWSTFVMSGFMSPLRRILRRDPRFTLTGREIDQKIIDQVFPNLRPIMSGDYVKSTDKLRSKYVKCCVEVLCRTVFSDIVSFFPGFKDLFYRTLSSNYCYELACKCTYKQRHDLSYHCPCSRGTLLMQRRGQLMGSVSSFPVLCLLNYALCANAMTRNPPEWRENILVNGDDCVFEACEEAKKKWENDGRTMGLEPSPGKCRYSMRECQMNSRTFVADLPPREFCMGWLAPTFLIDRESGLKEKVFAYQEYPERRWRKIPALLTGLALGKKRSSAGGSRETEKVYDMPSAFAEYCDELVKPTTSQTSFFVSNFRKLIKERVMLFPNEAVIPWCVPVEHGGFGLPGNISVRDYSAMAASVESGFEFMNITRPKEWIFHDNLMKMLRKWSVEAPLDPTDPDADLGPLYWYTFVTMGSKNRMDDPVNYKQFLTNISSEMSHPHIMKRMRKGETRTTYVSPESKNKWDKVITDCPLLIGGDGYEVRRMIDRDPAIEQRVRFWRNPPRRYGWEKFLRMRGYDPIDPDDADESWGCKPPIWLCDPEDLMGTVRYSKLCQIHQRMGYRLTDILKDVPALGPEWNAELDNLLLQYLGVYCQPVKVSDFEW